MTKQRIEKAIYFPTLGVGMEEALKDDTEAVAKLLLDRETITHDDMVDLIGKRPFEGDPAYAEYVSQKSRRPMEEEAKQEKVEREEDNNVPPVENLTPGLA